MSNAPCSRVSRIDGTSRTSIPRSEERLERPPEVLEIGKQVERVVAHQDLGLAHFLCDSSGGFGGEELAASGQPLAVGLPRGPRGRVHAEHSGSELPQRRELHSVVARDLHDQGTIAERAPLVDLTSPLGEVLDEPRIGRGVVGVVVTIGLPGHVERDLHQGARAAEDESQRPNGVRDVQCIAGHETVGERGRPKVQDRRQIARAAAPAVGPLAHRSLQTFHGA